MTQQSPPPPSDRGSETGTPPQDKWNYYVALAFLKGLTCATVLAFDPPPTQKQTKNYKSRAPS